MFARHRAVLGFRQRIVIGMPGAGLGKFDQQLLQQCSNSVVDVLRTVIGMESQDDERKSFQQLLNDRQQVRLADLLMELLAI